MGYPSCSPSINLKLVLDRLETIRGQEENNNKTTGGQDEDNNFAELAKKCVAERVYYSMIDCIFVTF
jgi:hypothetical protein